LERFRKKWYKKNIDPSFDLNVSPAAAAPVIEEKKE